MKNFSIQGDSYEFVKPNLLILVIFKEVLQNLTNQFVQERLFDSSISASIASFLTEREIRW